ncbi:hypothetical protein BC937DRAFT_95389 [Endogone sp. FLAS-F59071]|nr:hypothetical protein BC937DRAFT_95389 [Endogone sp. FLAS-F59071]|eukprot:RUS20356.1 hypothetical protein BC937DRAFT_95389 [Endogone sp. FLAS-F59071]
MPPADAHTNVFFLVFTTAIGGLCLLLPPMFWRRYRTLYVLDVLAGRTSCPIITTSVYIANTTWKLIPGDPFYCTHSGPVDVGHFLTGIFIVTGFGLPFVLAHAAVVGSRSLILSDFMRFLSVIASAITVPAMIMSILGGILVYSTSKRFV